MKRIELFKMGQSDDLINTLCSDLRPVKPLMPWRNRMVIWVAIALLCLISTVAMMGIKTEEIANRSNLWFWLETGFIMILIVASGSSALVLSVPGSEKNIFQKLLPFLTILGWIALLALKMSVRGGHGIWHEILSYSNGAGCAKGVVMFSLLPGAIMVYLVKRAAPIKPGLVGFFAFTAVFGVGALTLQFLCPIEDSTHIFVWHALPVIILGGLGVLLGKVFFRW